MNIITRLVSLPTTARAVVRLDADGDYNIYINSNISFAQQRAAFKHELRHIRRGHFENQISTAQAETEAEK